MIGFEFTLPDIEKEVQVRIVEANNEAVKAAAAVAIGPARAAVPVGKTGQMQAQTQIKYFKQYAGMIGAAIKVVGNRHFVEHILEYGARTHGGRRAKGSRVRKGAKFSSRLHAADRGPIRARHIFGNVFMQIQSQIESAYTNTFATKFNV